MDANNDGNPDACEITNFWYPFTKGTWFDATEASTIWTGFYGGEGTGTPRSFSVGGAYVPPTSVGARVLGQKVDDRFGISVGSDSQWLYIAAPAHTAAAADVPGLVPLGQTERPTSGVVYQLRTNVRAAPEQPNAAQLWIEPGVAYPNIDAELPGRVDYTMPVPHQWIIESVGSTRGDYTINTDDFVFADVDACPGDSLKEIIRSFDKTWAKADPLSFEIANSGNLNGYYPYATSSAGDLMDRTPQIVGPHDGAQIAFVRALGDVNGDGVRDFAVGSPNVKKTVVLPVPGGQPSPVNFSGPEVGSLFIVYGRGVGLEGDYLLEYLAADTSAPGRLTGVLLQGTSANERLARVIDNAGDFNADGKDDVAVGNENGNGGTGEALVVLGSQLLESPAGGWTITGIVSAGYAIRLLGESPGDRAGANVAGAGDVDGDGYTDVLVAAPGVDADINGDGILDADVGAVYLIYGSPALAGTIPLSKIGTVDLPGVKFIGRGSGDELGGGALDVSYTVQTNNHQFTAYSRGVSRLGDIDGDGYDDYALSAMLADPNNRVNSGEVYVLYGTGDPK